MGGLKQDFPRRSQDELVKALGFEDPDNVTFGEVADKIREIIKPYDWDLDYVPVEGWMLTKTEQGNLTFMHYVPLFEAGDYALWLQDQKGTDNDKNC